MDEQHQVEYERRLTEVEQRSKSNTKRIDELAEDQKSLQSLVSSVNALATKQEVMTVKQETMNEGMEEIKSDVKSLKAVPAKRWENLVAILISVVVGFLFAKAGIA